MLSDPFSGVARDESPLSVTTSQPGHSDSLAPQIDIEGAARGEGQKKTRKNSSTRLGWERLEGYRGGGGSQHMGGGQQILTEARGDQPPPASDT